MWDWLASPIDPSRAHEVSAAVAWHSRAMFLSWAVLAPLAVIVARFFKIKPGQNWPEERDTTFWGRSHWIGQTLGLVLTLLGLILALACSRLGRRSQGYRTLFLLPILIPGIIIGAIWRSNSSGMPIQKSAPVGPATSSAKNLPSDLPDTLRTNSPTVQPKLTI